MVIPPAYYAATLKQDWSQIEQYYVDICQGSPVSARSRVCDWPVLMHHRYQSFYTIFQPTLLDRIFLQKYCREF